MPARAPPGRPASCPPAHPHLSLVAIRALVPPSVNKTFHLYIDFLLKILCVGSKHCGNKKTFSRKLLNKRARFQK